MPWEMCLGRETLGFDCILWSRRFFLDFFLFVKRRFSNDRNGYNDFLHNKFIRHYLQINTKTLKIIMKKFFTVIFASNFLSSKTFHVYVAYTIQKVPVISLFIL